MKAKHPVKIAIPVLLGVLLAGLGMVSLGGPRVEAGAPLELRNAIQNGGFEVNPTASVAAGWQAFDNGQAHFGWYMEEWEQAVHSGRRSQLMEIFQNTAPDRVIAIYQTVPVVPHTVYRLTIHAQMRSDAALSDRNKGDFGMDWGIDYSGRGDYYRVSQWVNMPLTEQYRRGPYGPADDSQHLFFETITGTVQTGNSRQITLFIRGVKKYPTGTEVNFNVDDVTLIGPYPAAEPAAVVEPSTDAVLPGAGDVLGAQVPLGLAGIAGLVLVALGMQAALALLRRG